MDLDIALLGTSCRISSDDDEVVRRLRSVLAPFGVALTSTLPVERATLRRSGTDETVVLDFRGERFEGRCSPVLSRLVAQLTAAAIERFDGLAVHAGVVSVDGAGLVLAAESGVGKSTSTAACLLRGFDYVSDEALCVPRGALTAVPFPKPIALSGHSAELLGLGRARLDTKDLWTTEALGAAVAAGPVRVAHVVSLCRTGAGASEPVELDRSSAVATLLEMSFNAYRDPATAMATSSAIARGARSWRLDVSDPNAAADALYALVAAPSGG